MNFLMPPASIDRGIQFLARRFVPPSVCPQKLLNWPYLLKIRTFIFHMSIPCEYLFLILSSRPSFNVKYQRNTFREKKGRCGTIGVSPTHLVSLVFCPRQWICTYTLHSSPENPPIYRERLR